MKSHTVEVSLRGSSPMSECHEKVDQTDILDLDENLEYYSRSFWIVIFLKASSLPSGLCLGSNYCISTEWEL